MFTKVEQKLTLCTVYNNLRLNISLIEVKYSSIKGMFFLSLNSRLWLTFRFWW